MREAGSHLGDGQDRRRGLTAARGTNEDDKLLVGDVEVEVLHRLIAVGIPLANVFQFLYLFIQRFYLVLLILDELVQVFFLLVML